MSIAKTIAALLLALSGIVGVALAAEHGSETCATAYDCAGD